MSRNYINSPILPIILVDSWHQENRVRVVCGMDVIRTFIFLYLTLFRLIENWILQTPYFLLSTYTLLWNIYLFEWISIRIETPTTDMKYSFVEHLQMLKFRFINFRRIIQEVSKSFRVQRKKSERRWEVISNGKDAYALWWRFP